MVAVKVKGKFICFVRGVFFGHAVGSTVSRSNVNGCSEHFFRPGAALAVVPGGGGDPDDVRFGGRGGGGGGGGLSERLIQPDRPLVGGDPDDVRFGGRGGGGGGAGFSEQLIQPSRPLERGGRLGPEAAEEVAAVA